MTAEAPTRALAAIVAIDIAGYSAASEQDETAAVAMVQALRTAARSAAERHRGRIFNTAGDGIMLTLSVPPMHSKRHLIC